MTFIAQVRADVTERIKGLLLRSYLESTSGSGGSKGGVNPAMQFSRPSSFTPLGIYPRLTYTISLIFRRIHKFRSGCFIGLFFISGKYACAACFIAMHFRGFT